MGFDCELCRFVKPQQWQSLLIDVQCINQISDYLYCCSLETFPFLLLQEKKFSPLSATFVQNLRLTVHRNHKKLCQLSEDIKCVRGYEVLVSKLGMEKVFVGAQIFPWEMNRNPAILQWKAERLIFFTQVKSMIIYWWVRSLKTHGFSGETLFMWSAGFGIYLTTKLINQKAKKKNIFNKKETETQTVAKPSPRCTDFNNTPTKQANKLTFQPSFRKQCLIFHQANSSTCTISTNTSLLEISHHFLYFAKNKHQSLDQLIPATPFNINHYIL